MVEATPLLQGSAPRGRRVARAQVAVGLLGLLVGALLVMSLRSGGVRRVALGETNDYNSWIGSLGSDDETKEFQLDMKTSAAVQSDYTDPAQEVPEQLAKFKRAVSLEREKYKALKEIVDENEADKPEALVVRVAERGEVGPKGPRGVRGVQGDEGDPGPKGPPGPPGDLGPRGDRGPIGPTGPKGNPGDKGKRGFEGRVGKRGPQGPEGGGGNKGDTGPPGDRGPPGPQGGNGGVGDEGPDGATGDEGEAGTSRFKVIMATIG